MIEYKRLMHLFVIRCKPWYRTFELKFPFTKHTLNALRVNSFRQIGRRLRDRADTSICQQREGQFSCWIMLEHKSVVMVKELAFVESEIGGLASSICRL